MLEDCEEVYVLTPSRWDPHNDSYAHNESQMIDWQGEMVEPKNRQTIMLSEVEEDPEIAAACYIGHVESQRVIELLDRNTVDEHDSPNTTVKKEKDEIASVLLNVNPLLTDESLYERLNNRNKVSQFQTAIGSTYASKHDHVMPDDTCTTDDISPDYMCDDEEALLDKIFEEPKVGTLDLDDIMVSAVHAGRHQGVNAKRLATIWRIDENTATRTLDATEER